MKRTRGRFYKKLHKWPGLIVATVLLYYAVSGILMNHRDAISHIDIDRDFLPGTYRYHNWNLAALKGNAYLNSDSVLVYGNVGIWLTDSAFSSFESLNAGFPKGIDNRKVFDVLYTPKKSLFAATLFGLYVFDFTARQWKYIAVSDEPERFVALQLVGDSVLVASRSFVYKGVDNGIKTHFNVSQVAAPENYQKKVSLFETIWQIHSGELFGDVGKLMVDLLGLLTLFLSVTGILYFFLPSVIKRIRPNSPTKAKIVGFNRWSLRWHNKFGAWIFVLLIIVYATGMFLRPPLLIPIANVEVAPIKFSNLDNENPWHDKIRDLYYDSARSMFMLATSDGIYEANRSFTAVRKYRIQPPVSVMGITVFEPFADDAFLIGSFSGLFLWHPAHDVVYDFTTGQPAFLQSAGRPVGNFAVSGLIKKPNNQLFMVDYDRGAMPLWHSKPFALMPQEVIEQSGMSLWNVSLEIHTGRIFSFLVGDFYILLVPLTGLVAIMVVVSGYLLWRKRFRKKKI